MANAKATLDVLAKFGIGLFGALYTLYGVRTGSVPNMLTGLLILGVGSADRFLFLGRRDKEVSDAVALSADETAALETIAREAVERAALSHGWGGKKKQDQVGGGVETAAPPVTPRGKPAS